MVPPARCTSVRYGHSKKRRRLEFSKFPPSGLLGNSYAVPCIGPARWVTKLLLPSPSAGLRTNTSWGTGWICATLHQSAPNSECSQEELLAASHALGALSSKPLWLSRLTRERNREGGDVFVPCIGLREIRRAKRRDHSLFTEARRSRCVLGSSRKTGVGGIMLLWWRRRGSAREKREEGGRSSDAPLHDAVRLHPGGLGSPH